MCECVPVSVSVNTVSPEAIRRHSPATGITDVCQVPCSCWGSNEGPLKRQQVPLTTEPASKTAFLIMTLSLGLGKEKRSAETARSMSMDSPKTQ